MELCENATHRNVYWAGICSETPEGFMSEQLKKRSKLRANRPGNQLGKARLSKLIKNMQDCSEFMVSQLQVF